MHDLEERLGRLSRAVVRYRESCADMVHSRDNAIREADSEGWTLGRIAAATRLARQTVHEIVCKTPAGP